MELDNKVLNTVKKVLKKYNARRVLVAVSGGVDSMVLLNIIGQLLPKTEFGVVNVDHDLRPESADEVAFVQDFCAKNEYQFFTTKWMNKPQDNVGMEASARQFRYGFFKEIMQSNNFDTLLTAHHANDLAENILMKLIRSGNAYEVVSLKQQRPFANGQIVRPLLDFAKSDITVLADIHDIHHVQDQTNFSNITLRNRLRNNIFPELQKENGQMLTHFNFFERQLIALLDLAKSKFKEIEEAMQVSNVDQQVIGLINPVRILDYDQQNLFWGNFFTKQHFEIAISNRQIDEIVGIVSGNEANASIDLADSWQFIRSYDKFVIKKSQPMERSAVSVTLGQEINFIQKKFTLTANNTDFSLTTDWIPKTITLRTRRDGDKLLIADGQHQKLSKRFINKKIPEYKRDNYLVLLFDNQIVWVEKIYNMSDYLKKGNNHYKIKLD
ncbi:tRNA lysidine(34) synthetase TilS [Companilactobacillus alimentarius]|uniref:tRNA(Ile)-lysidine synthase n=1 Tax=Companilactobacillus alimentarius DSM 20249 TaxID=1423720 RepID=A0A2K9HPV2_9LACO|nr:tRNA lysidine(34) synthetase TilS [Companilactobacillus alimentarius]AUI72573.1 tRNA lysidine(34) synthetase TilS [Companilactobacillus alimentarius DSM 20249]KRK76364.1 tRNA(Ile)-lysidine synthase [Companilactobacillus alimentarius DSM 20249]MDT6952306.1 tRNA lysidine(34) synthetase TilS [Companilactobacillus alimentarius]GEO45581.1 tRNA(Ile)-lysidine synthase [Companilactobacillus alimentarius]